MKSSHLPSRLRIQVHRDSPISSRRCFTSDFSDVQCNHVVMAPKSCFLIWFQIAVTSIVFLKVSASQNVMHSTAMNIHIQSLSNEEDETYVDDLSKHLSSTDILVMYSSTSQ